MSSRRATGTAARVRVKCAICGGNANREPTLLSDGRKVCRRCRDEGRLAQRLPCGHIGVPGTIVITDSNGGGLQCVQCSPHSAYSRMRGKS